MEQGFYTSKDFLPLVAKASKPGTEKWFAQNFYLLPPKFCFSFCCSMFFSSSSVLHVLEIFRKTFINSVPWHNAWISENVSYKAFLKRSKKQSKKMPTMSCYTRLFRLTLIEWIAMAMDSLTDISVYKYVIFLRHACLSERHISSDVQHKYAHVRDGLINLYVHVLGVET